MAVINDMTGYCASAKASFETALGTKTDLTVFILDTILSISALRAVRYRRRRAS
jgi:hypothetical protein